MIQNVHYCVHMSPPHITILRKVNPINTITSYFFTIYFSIIIQVFWLASFLNLTPPKSCMNEYCTASHPWLHHTNNIWGEVQIMKLQIMWFYSNLILLLPSLAKIQDCSVIWQLTVSTCCTFIILMYVTCLTAHIMRTVVTVGDKW